MIASQAVISGAFSVTRQAVTLGYLPRLRVRHTSPQEGQIYVPLVNWALLAAVILLVIGFERSAKLASAYGIAVTGTITITTLLFFVHALARSPSPWIVAAAVFLAVDLSFFLANVDKIVSGGWLPLLVAVSSAPCSSRGSTGRGSSPTSARRSRARCRRSCGTLHGDESKIVRVPGTAVFLNRGDAHDAARHARRSRAPSSAPRHVVVLSMRPRPVPHVPPEQQPKISDLGFRDDDISHVTAHFGFQDTPNVTEVLRQAESAGLECPLEVEEASYFLSKIELLPTGAPGISAVAQRLFVATAHLAADPVE